MNYTKLTCALVLSAFPMFVLAEADTTQTAPKTEEASAEYTKSSAKFTAEEALALAKKSQNPISNMRSFKFQNNTNLGIGPDDST